MNIDTDEELSDMKKIYMNMRTAHDLIAEAAGIESKYHMSYNGIKLADISEALNLHHNMARVREYELNGKYDKFVVVIKTNQEKTIMAKKDGERETVILGIKETVLN